MSRHRNRQKSWPPAEALIESLNLEEQGIAHLDGKAVFISGAIR
ncbi:MAG: hypothetical protein R3E89_11940 [Thiolinea sp.]